MYRTIILTLVYPTDIILTKVRMQRNKINVSLFTLRGVPLGGQNKTQILKFISDQSNLTKSSELPFNIFPSLVSTLS